MLQAGLLQFLSLSTLLSRCALPQRRESAARQTWQNKQEEQPQKCCGARKLHVENHWLILQLTIWTLYGCSKCASVIFRFAFGCLLALFLWLSLMAPANPDRAKAYKLLILYTLGAYFFLSKLLSRCLYTPAVRYAGNGVVAMHVHAQALS